MALKLETTLCSSSKWLQQYQKSSYNTRVNATRIFYFFFVIEPAFIITHHHHHRRSIVCTLPLLAASKWQCPFSSEPQSSAPRKGESLPRDKKNNGIMKSTLPIQTRTAGRGYRRNSRIRNVEKLLYQIREFKNAIYHQFSTNSKPK